MVCEEWTVECNCTQQILPGKYFHRTWGHGKNRDKVGKKPASQISLLLAKEPSKSESNILHNYQPRKIGQKDIFRGNWFRRKSAFPAKIVIHGKSFGLRLNLDFGHRLLSAIFWIEHPVYYFGALSHGFQPQQACKPWHYRHCFWHVRTRVLLELQNRKMQKWHVFP